MTHLTTTAFRFTAFAVALLRGLGEFASLQRWRVREWLAR